MTKNDYLAIGAGLVVGLLLIRWMNRTTDASDEPAPTAPAPAWAPPGTTLGDLWQNGF